jgi:hypothetical protein
MKKYRRLIDIDIEESDDNVDGHFTERKIKLISLLIDRLLLAPIQSEALANL